MTHIPINPQHSGFGNFKMPSTDAEWKAFWSHRNSPDRKCVRIRTNGDGTGFFQFKDGSKEHFQCHVRYQRIKKHFNIPFG